MKPGDTTLQGGRGMKRKGQQQPATTSERFRDLADAIDVLVDKPLSMNMHPLWGVLDEQERELMRPDEARDLAESKAELRAMECRREAVHQAFSAARIDLQEDDAVLLEGALSALPCASYDAHTPPDPAPHEALDKMRELAKRLRFRAHRMELGQPAADVSTTEGRKCCTTCGWIHHEGDFSKWVYPRTSTKKPVLVNGIKRKRFLRFLHEGMEKTNGDDVELQGFTEINRNAPDAKSVLGSKLKQVLYLSTGRGRGKIRPPEA